MRLAPLYLSASHSFYAVLFPASVLFCIVPNYWPLAALSVDVYLASPGQFCVPVATIVVRAQNGEGKARSQERKKEGDGMEPWRPSAGVCVVLTLQLAHPLGVSACTYLLVAVEVDAMHHLDRICCMYLFVIVRSLFPTLGVVIRA
jgi:hypothetical protein